MMRAPQTIRIEEDIVKAIHVLFSILVVAILSFAVAGHAQTATITYTYDDLNRVTNVR
jgi:hypothetical protein